MRTLGVLSRSIYSSALLVNDRCLWVVYWLYDPVCSNPAFELFGHGFSLVLGSISSDAIVFWPCGINQHVIYYLNTFSHRQYKIHHNTRVWHSEYSSGMEKWKRLVTSVEGDRWVCKNFVQHARMISHLQSAALPKSTVNYVRSDDQLSQLHQATHPSLLRVFYLAKSDQTVRTSGTYTERMYIWMKQAN